MGKHKSNEDRIRSKIKQLDQILRSKSREAAAPASSDSFQYENQLYEDLEDNSCLENGDGGDNASHLEDEPGFEFDIVVPTVTPHQGEENSEHWGRILVEGLVKEQKKALFAKTLILENFTLPKASRLNPEVASILNDPV
ncbi:unnamed protein product [Diatraea saccharalis]|uniref:Uncharacterized protein n=1 Tax=Diatraea saccharalis TaxID=40085 RepID=A0A9N9WF41_9NEOP|nr:unnamed protein product [Diatraea saccharalis]